MTTCRTYRHWVVIPGFFIGLNLLTLPTNAQTIHAILVADTHDPQLHTVCKRDIETMHRQFVQVANAIDYRLSEQVLSGDAFSRKRVEEAIRRVVPGPDDILFLYYTGHGYNARQRTGRFPVLMLEKEETNSRNNPGLLTVHQLLKSRKARLCITLGDCCNNLSRNMRGMVRKTTAPGALQLSNDSLNAAYRKLFLNVTGDALIASSKPPEQACAHPDSGSFYTRSFDEALEMGSQYNQHISWESLLRDAQTRLNRHQATQNKQSIYEVKVHSAGTGNDRLATAQNTVPLKSGLSAEKSAGGQSYTQPERTRIADNARRFVLDKYLTNLEILTHYEANQPFEALQQHLSGLVKDAFLNREVLVFNEFRNSVNAYTTIDEYVKDCRIFAAGKPITTTIDLANAHYAIQQTKGGQPFINVYVDKQVQGTDKQGKAFRFQHLAEFRVAFRFNSKLNLYHSFSIAGIASVNQWPPTAFTSNASDRQQAGNKPQDLLTVLTTLTEQLRETLPDSGQQLGLDMFTYKRCGVNNALSDRVFATLGSCLRKQLNVAVLSPTQYSGHELRLRGYYLEDHNNLRLIAELYEPQNNRVLKTLTNTALPLSWLSQQNLPLKPANFEQLSALRDTLQQTSSIAPKTLTITLRTNRGRTNPEYWEGKELLLDVKANKPCHLRLVYLLADGTKTLLENDFEIKAGQENQYIRIAPDASFICAAPFGMEHLLAYAAEAAFCPLPTQPNPKLYVRDDGGYTVLVGSLPAMVEAVSCTKSGREVAQDCLQITTRSVSLNK